MKETIKINLNNQLFDLDNDAYERLKGYLDSLKNQFSNTPQEAEEIIQDIESRIAEILQEKLTKNKQVISLADIEEIISLIGTAEEMEEPDEKDESGPADSGNPKQTYYKSSKRLYRDPLNKIFGGVCSGLGAYFGIDPVWIRLLFVLLFFAKLSGALIYIILWVVLQPAYSTAQRLKMQGKNFNVNDIGDSVKKEYEKVKNNVKDLSNSNTYKRAENGFSEFFRILGEVILVFLKVIAAIIIVSLIVSLIIAVLGFISHGGFHIPWRFHVPWNFQWHWHWWPDFNFKDISFFNLCVFLVIAIPVIALILKFAKWLLNIKSQNSFLSGIGAAAWVIAFISIIVLVVAEEDRTFFRRLKVSEYSLSNHKDDPLYVELKSSFKNDDLEFYHIFDSKIIRNEDKDMFLTRPKLILEPGFGEEIKLEITRNYAFMSSGRFSKHAYDMIEYSWKYDDATLQLDQYCAFDEEDAWRFPRITVKLIIPEGQKIFIDEELNNLLTDNIPPHKVLQMHNGTLEQLSLN